MGVGQLIQLGWWGHVRDVSDEVFVSWGSGQQMINYRLNDYDLIAEGEPGYLEV